MLFVSEWSKVVLFDSTVIEIKCSRERLEREAAKKHVEFAGRRSLGEIAKLYIKMESAKEEVV